MILFPPAKINLGLNVIQKREDGFHEIETVMYPIPLNDILEIIPHDEFVFKQSGLEIPGDANTNLCVRAFDLMRNRYDISPVYIHLIKKIPMGAGLGGGSSDAASVLLGIKQIFSLDCSDDQLRELAAELGSDCPFFISAQPQFAEGRGEVLQNFPVDLKGYYLKLIYPEIHVSTAEAYSKVHLSGKRSLKEAFEKGINSWRDELFNAFEQPVFHLHDSLQKLKDELYDQDAIYASMSGSGSTIFGLFRDMPTTSGDENEWVLKL